MSSRANVLSVYKNMLKLARTLPEPKRTSSVVEIRRQFRENKGDENLAANDVEALLEKANSSLGYLKIIAPRSSRSAAGSGGHKQSGVTKLVFGEAGEGGPKFVKKAVSNWTGSNMDPDSVSRHYQGLKRMGFKNNSAAKGIF